MSKFEIPTLSAGVLAPLLARVKRQYSSRSLSAIPYKPILLKAELVSREPTLNAAELVPNYQPLKPFTKTRRARKFAIWFWTNRDGSNEWIGILLLAWRIEAGLRIYSFVKWGNNGMVPGRCHIITWTNAGLL